MRDADRPGRQTLLSPLPGTKRVQRRCHQTSIGSLWGRGRLEIASLSLDLSSERHLSSFSPPFFETNGTMQKKYLKTASLALSPHPSIP